MANGGIILLLLMIAHRQACGYYHRWGLSYFALINQFVWMAILLVLVLFRKIAAYREMMTSFYTIVLINGLMVCVLRE